MHRIILIIFLSIFAATTMMTDMARAEGDGLWRFEFHRHNRTGDDPGKVNLRTRMATVTARAENGKLKLQSYKNFSSKDDFSRSFRGRISRSGAMRIQLRIDGLFGPTTDIKTVSARGNVLNAAVGSKYVFDGTKLWSVLSLKEHVYLRLHVAKVSN